jgi:tetratricopeptide (TPR) repeat protein
LLADAAEAAEQMQRALHHRRQAVMKAELEAGKVGARVEWPALLWQSLYGLSELLGKQNLTEEALRTSEKALALARREAVQETVYARWHHREFRTLMASTDFLRQRGTAVMGRYEEAARLPGSRYEASSPVGSAAEDLWTVMNTIGAERFKQGELDPAAAAHHEALQIAQRALGAEPQSDDWLNRAASSHTGLADAAQARKARLLEATHRYSAVDLSARRSATTLASPGDQRDHWLRLYYLAKVQQDLQLHRDAMGSLTLARALARRFAEQLPNDRFWQEYLWFSEQEIGSMKKPPQDASSAESALVAAAAIAESMIAKGHDFKQWGGKAADSLEALARENRQQGREVDARRASVQASGYRSKLQAMKREAQVRAQVKQHVNGLLDALALTAERAEALSKAELMTRMQEAIDQTTDAAMKTGMDGVQSQRLTRLQNALFVVRQLPGP